MPAEAEPIAIKLQGRYELRARLTERCGVVRFRGVDTGDGSGPPVPVVVLRQELPALATPLPVEVVAEAVPVVAVADADADEEIMPGFDDPMAVTNPITEVLPPRPSWPGLAWEQGILRAIEQPGLPRVLDHFSDEAFEYLVEEVPTGRSL